MSLPKKSGLVDHEMTEEGGRPNEKGKKSSYNLACKGKREYFRPDSVMATKKTNIPEEVVREMEPEASALRAR